MKKRNKYLLKTLFGVSVALLGVTVMQHAETVYAAQDDQTDIVVTEDFEEEALQDNTEVVEEEIISEPDTLLETEDANSVNSEADEKEEPVENEQPADTTTQIIEDDVEPVIGDVPVKEEIEEVKPNIMVDDDEAVIDDKPVTEQEEEVKPGRIVVDDEVVIDDVPAEETVDLVEDLVLLVQQTPAQVAPAKVEPVTTETPVVVTQEKKVDAPVQLANEDEALELATDDVQEEPAVEVKEEKQEEPVVVEETEEVTTIEDEQAPLAKLPTQEKENKGFVWGFLALATALAGSVACGLKLKKTK